MSGLEYSSTNDTSGKLVVSTRLKVAEVVGKALLTGAADSWVNPTIRLSGQCLNPQTLELRGEATRDHPDPRERLRRYATMEVRCRRCEPCLQHRSMLWAARACHELDTASRTWFGTLTINPEHRARLGFEATARLRRASQSWVPDFMALKPAERFAALHREVNDELTRWLKRVRKNSAAKFRYIIVVEAHNCRCEACLENNPGWHPKCGWKYEQIEGHVGFPHYHLLLHEQSDEVLHKVMTDAWRLGFSKLRLVDETGNHPAFYVAKYLAKSALARVRASRFYGDPTRATPVRAALTSNYLRRNNLDADGACETEEEKGKGPLNGKLREVSPSELEDNEPWETQLRLQK